MIEEKNFSRMQFSFWQRNFFLLQNFLPFPFVTKSRDFEKRTLSFLLLTQLLFCVINVFLDGNWAFGQLTSVRHKKNYMTANFAFLQHSKKILVGSVQFIFRLHNFHFLSALTTSKFLKGGFPLKIVSKEAGIKQRPLQPELTLMTTSEVNLRGPI